MSNPTPFIVSEELEYYLFAQEEDCIKWEYVDTADEYQAFSDNFNFLDREFKRLFVNLY